MATESRDQLERGIVRVLDEEGLTRGTGFIIAPGLVLTCHHVVGGVSPIQVRDATGESHTATLAEEAALRVHDLALLEASSLRLPALPVHPDSQPPLRFRSRGFFYGTLGFDAAVPIDGTVTGNSSVSYDSYSLKRVWVLAGVGFDRGISGGPCADFETGVATGVMNTRLLSQGGVTGTAIPLASAADASPRLQRALDENRRSVPRYGRLVNAAGARALCSHQATASVDELKVLGVYVASRYAPRPEIEQVIERFREQARPLLPLVGPAGTGKSSLLAHVAATAERATLLIRAVNMREHDRHLGEHLEFQFQTLCEEHGLPVTPAHLALDALAEDGTPGLLLLDGLNEARMGTTALESGWIPSTHVWLGKHTARLALSCRYELWERVKHAVPGTAILEAPEVSNGVLGVRDFSPVELDRVAAAYGLPAAVIARSDFLRHPLAMRLFCEGADGMPLDQHGPRNLAAVLDAYLKRLCTNVANRMEHGGPTVAGVLDMLRGVAKTMMDRHTLALGRSDYQAAFHDFPQVAAECERERVFEEAEGSLRFTFDEVAEHLQAASIALKDVVTPAVLKSIAGSGQPISTAVFLSVLLREDPRSALVVDVVRTISNERDPDLWALRSVLYRFIQLTPARGDFLPELTRLVATAAEESVDLEYHEATDAVADTELPVEVALSLLRVLAIQQDGYFWRDKDRDRDDFGQMSGAGFSRAMRSIIERDTPSALRGLVTWLGDDTALQGTEGSLGAMAGIAIAYYRTRWDVDFIDLLANTDASRAAQLLRHAAQRDPDVAYRACLRWIEGGTRLRRARALDVARVLPGDDPTRQHEILGRLFASAVDPSERSEVARALLASGDRSDEVWSAIIEGYQAGTASLRDLVRGRPDSWPQVRDLLREQIATWIGPDPLDVGALAELPPDLDIQRDVANILVDILARSGEHALRVARVIEDNLYRLDESLLAQSGQLAVAHELLEREDDAALRCLCYGAFSAVRIAQPGEAIRRLQDAIVLRSIERGLVPQLLVTVSNTNNRALVRRVLDAIAARMPVTPFEKVFLRSIGNVSANSEELMTWARDNANHLPRSAEHLIRSHDAGVRLLSEAWELLRRYY